MREFSYDVRYNVHDVAIALDKKLVRDRDSVDGGDTANIVAAKVKQHEVFGALLRIGKKLFLEGLILVGCRAAMACAGNRANGDDVTGNFHQDFRARSRDGKGVKIQKIEVGRGIGSSQRTVE